MCLFVCLFVHHSDYERIEQLQPEEEEGEPKFDVRNNIKKVIV